MRENISQKVMQNQQKETLTRGNIKRKIINVPYMKSADFSYILSRKNIMIKI